MATSLDLIDNFFGPPKRRGLDIAHLPDQTISELTEEVQRFAESYEPCDLDVRRFPAYLGGWPSANFFAAYGDLIFSTLLYSGQVLVKDPIIDWFSPQQYLVEHLVSARQGYLNDNGRANTSGTRRFLSVVVPALNALRPLIESGVIVMVPGERFFAEHDKSIRELRHRLAARLVQDADEITRRFAPTDLAVDDNRRGMFVFAGGDRIEQLSKAIDQSLGYFAREWSLARGYGADYVAPWKYEQYICEKGLEKVITNDGNHRIINALFQSSLPIFHGLTPRIIADIHNADTFAEFRLKLYDTYSRVPNCEDEGKLLRFLAQIEEVQLRPLLDRARQEARAGFLSRLGVLLTDGIISIAPRLAFDAATGQFGLGSAAREVIGFAVDEVRDKRYRGRATVWTKLYRHHRSVGEELRPIRLTPQSDPHAAQWTIAEQPSMSEVFSVS